MEPQPTAPPRCTPGRCTYPGDGLCDPCADLLAGHLRDLPALWRRLQDGVAPQAGSPFASAGRGGRGGSWAAPIDTGVVDHMTLTARLLGQWAARIAGQRAITPPPAAPAFRFHTIHAAWSAGRPWGKQYAADMWRLWRTAVALTRSWPAPAQHVPGVPCPRAQCSRMALYRRSGEDGYVCEPHAGGCGGRLSDKEYVTWTRALARPTRAAG